jgi:hypothetical protein
MPDTGTVKDYDMADTWLTIEQAAVALGLSVRTVNRHIAGGKLQSRLTDGRREVLVSLPDEAPSAASGQNEPIEPPGGASHFPSDDGSHYHGSHAAAHPQGGFDHASVLALADNAAEKAEMAVAAYQALARSTDQQFQHVRRSARVAWGAVAVMAAGVSVAVGWTTHHLTRSQVTTQYLQERVEQTANASDRLSVERDALKLELSAAKEQAARAEGRASTLTELQARLETQVQNARAKLARSEEEAAVDLEVQGEPETNTVSDATSDTPVEASAAEAKSAVAPGPGLPTTRPTFMDKITSLVNRPTE